MKHTTLLLILALLISFYGNSQNTPTWINCLSGENVNDVAENEEYLWMATSGGLVLHNKTSNTIDYYNCANSELPSNYVSQVLLDGDGVLWLTSNGLTSIERNTWVNYSDINGHLLLDEIGTLTILNNSNLLKWNGLDFTPFPIPDELGGLVINDAIIDKDNGDVWASAYTFGIFKIFHFTGGVWSIFDSNNSDLPWESSDGNEFAFDHRNDLWLTTYGGLFKFEEEWIDKSSLLPTMTSNSLEGIDSDELGNIFIISRNWGLSGERDIIVIDSLEVVSEIEYVKKSNDDPFPKFIKVAQDQKSLYAGFANQGCWKYENSSWTKLESGQTDFTTNELSISQDSEGRIYVQNGSRGRYFDNEIFMYSEEKWNALSQNEPFNGFDKFGFKILDGRDENDVWMYLNSSLYQLNSGEWTIPALPDLEVDVDEYNSFVHYDHNGDQWLLENYQSNIYYNKGGSWQSFPHGIHGARSGAYFSFFNHPVTNDFWTSTYNGISIYNYASESWSLILPRELGLLDNRVTLEKTEDQEVYGFCRNQFFRMVGTDSAEVITTTEMLGHGDGFYSLLSENDTIWVGMNGAVLKYYDDQLEVIERSNAGIVNGPITGVVRDANGNLWFGSNGGGLAIYNLNGVTKDLLEKDFSSPIKEQNINIVFEVYPNPTSGKINVHLNDRVGTFNLEVYGAKGDILMHEIVKNEKQNIELSGLSSGVYFIKVIDVVSGDVGFSKVVLE